MAQPMEDVDLSALFTITNDDLLGDLSLGLGADEQPGAFSPTVFGTPATVAPQQQHHQQPLAPMDGLQFLAFTPAAPVKCEPALAPVVIDADVGNPVAPPAMTPVNNIVTAGNPFKAPAALPASATAAAPAKAKAAGKARRRRGRSNAGGSKRRAVDLDAMDPAQREEFQKLEDRRRRNRLAAARSRQKKSAIERREKEELHMLRVRTKEQETRIQVLTTENSALKSQLEFFKTWVSRSPPTDAFHAVMGAASRGNPHGTAVSGMADLAAAVHDAVPARNAAAPTAVPPAAAVPRGSAASVASLASDRSRSPGLDSMSSEEDVPRTRVRRVRYRARKRHSSSGLRRKSRSNDVDSGCDSATTDDSMSAVMAPASGCPASAAAASGARAASVAGAAFAIVFTFILSANLDGMAGQSLAAFGGAAAAASAASQASRAVSPASLLNMSPLFHDAAASAAATVVSEAPAVAARVHAAAPSRSGRVLATHDMSDESDATILRVPSPSSARVPTAITADAAASAARSRTLREALKWARATGVADTTTGFAPSLGDAAAAGAGDAAPPMPHLWSPSAAVTFALYAMGMKRFAEVILVNGLLLGIGIGVYSMVNKLRRAPPSSASLATAAHHHHHYYHSRKRKRTSVRAPSRARSVVAVGHARAVAARAAADQAALKAAAAVFSDVVLPTVPSGNPPQPQVLMQ